MAKEFKYCDENEKPYKILINSSNDKELILSFIEEKEKKNDGKNEKKDKNDKNDKNDKIEKSENDKIDNEKIEMFSSNYLLDDLNEKFGKVLHFKKINEFKNILIENINRKQLIIKSPYKNVINTIWKTFPKDSKNETFTLISSKSNNNNISIFFFENLTKSEPIIKEIEAQLIIKEKEKKVENLYSQIQFENNSFLDNLFFLKGKYEDENKKVNDYLKILETIKGKFEYRKLLILFDEYNMKESLLKIIEKCYKDQIFILIFTENDTNKVKLEIEAKINKLSETKKAYFDINNIFVLTDSSYGYKKVSIPILKVFSYFNQLGDGFFKQLPELGLKIEGLEQELGHLFFTHYFNILLCGKTGTGKSTFINKFMDEKKSFTLKSKSTGTFRNNFYIHKKYPIKIIDVCGFAEGTEAQENLEKLNLIYNKDSTNILIDEPMNDIFNFYGDRRNNIHLLLYFTIYNDKYDVIPGELPVIYEAVDKKIPIIFIVNKCPNTIFTDEDEMEDLKNDVLEARKKTDFEKYDTYFINCLNNKGFDKLLTGIYELYKKNIIDDGYLSLMNNYSLSQEDFNKLYKDSFFFGNIDPKDVFLNDSLIKSVIDIKNLIVKIAGYYSGELGFYKSFKFYFNNKIYNEIWRNATSNFFPLLTDLLKKIYSNFGIEKKVEECNKYIKVKISQYFNLEIPELKEEQKREEKENKKTTDGNESPAPYQFTMKQFERDYTILGKLFWNSEMNFKITEDIEREFLKQDSNLKEKIFTINEDNNIEAERIILLVKRDFGLDNSKRDATSKEKIFQKLFYISYTCNELIHSLCGEINHKGFKYQSIYSFYYNVSLSYNKAIKGFNNIQDEMKKKEKALKKYLRESKIKNNLVNEDEDAPEIAQDD